MLNIAGNNQAHETDRLERSIKKYQVSISPWVAEVISPCEMKVLLALLAGESLSDIAVARSRSVKTMSTQKRRLYEKLKIESDMMLYKNLLEQNAIMLLLC